MTQRQVLAFLKLFHVCVCVGGGGGGGSSDFFHFPKFQGGPTYVIQGEGGRQTLGGGGQLLSDRTRDLY